MSSFYTEQELKKIGFKHIGHNVLISSKTSIYGAQNMSIGNDVRIDDFCILSGNITIGNNVHIAASAMLFAGDAGIEMQDFSGLSSRSAIYAVSDDYSGEYLTNPTIPDQFKHIISGKVIVGKHVVIGTGSTILPGVTIREGCSVGAMSLINKTTEPWKIYVGIPAKPKSDRSKKVLDLEKQFYQSKLAMQKQYCM